MTLRAREVSDEVLVAEGPLVEIDADDIAEMKRRAATTPRRRLRICAHPADTAALHEMLIVHARGAYVRPHKHIGKSESVHVIEGEADLFLFDEQGAVTNRIALGPYDSERRFYYRIDEPLYHTLVIRSDHFVMHEVTNGPFDRAQTVFPAWAPEEGDTPAIDALQACLEAAQ